LDGQESGYFFCQAMQSFRESPQLKVTL